MYQPDFCQRFGIQPDGDISRLLTVLDGGIPDRVPYLEYWVTSPTIYQAVLGKPAPDSPQDRHDFALRTGQDAFLAASASWRPGCIYGQAADGSTHYLGGSIRSRDDLRDLQPPDLSAQLADLEPALEIAASSSLGAYAMMSSIFDGCYLAMGLEAFSLALFEDRPLIEALMDMLTDFYRAAAERLAQHRQLAFVQINDDIARKGGLFIHPELFHELWVPRMRHILEPLHAAGFRLTFHTDGTLDDVIPILADLGMRAVHPVEYAANDIRALKRKFGSTICLHGNVPIEKLLYAAPREIEQFTCQLVQDLKPGGHYICSSTTSIVEGTPPENFAAMIRAVQRCGRY